MRHYSLEGHMALDFGSLSAGDDVTTILMEPTREKLFSSKEFDVMMMTKSN